MNTRPLDVFKQTPDWGELGAVYMYGASLALRPFPEAYSLAREATHKALAVNPDYAPALASQ